MKVYINKKSGQQFKQQLWIKDETMIACLWFKSADIENALEEGTWVENTDAFSFEALNALTKENVGAMIYDFPDVMKKLYKHDLLGFETPGYYHLSSVLKWTKNDATNKSRLDMKGPQMWTFEVKNTGSFGRAYNMFPYTAISRDKDNSYFYKERVNASVAILSPLEDSPLDDCVLSLNCETTFPLQPNLEQDDGAHKLVDFIPIPRIVSENTIVRAEDKIQFSIEVIDKDGNPVSGADGSEVFLENTTGYLNKDRFIVGSDEHFSVRAMDLVPGNIIRVKAGWKSYPGLSEVTVTVVA